MTPALIIENLSYTYPDGTPGLRNVNLIVEKGSMTALAGANGSGKSTLLLHIMGLLNGRGKIQVCGIDRSPSSMNAIRSKIGALFGQTEYHFIMPDLLNDVMFSIDKNLDGEQRAGTALQLLEKMGLAGYSSKAPMDLSAGEMKKAAIAGVLAKDPEILLLDEPLSNLDKKSADDLIQLLRSLNKTIIFSTHHRLIVEELATELIIMDSGSIVKTVPKGVDNFSGCLKDLL